MYVSDKNIKRFKRAVTQLNRVIADCKKDSPDCYAYLDASNGMHLMDGSKQPGEAGDDKSIIAFATLSASGGDW